MDGSSPSHHRIMSDSSTSATVVAKRACDACRKRKIKCLADSGRGLRPCKNCSQSHLKCTYDAVPQKKGPKGSRAKVISELRANQRLLNRRDAFSSPPGSPSSPRTPLPPDVVHHCVDFFFSNMYPTQPILHRTSLQQAIGNTHRSIEAYCLVTSLCAYMMIQPNMRLPATSPSADNDADLGSTTMLGMSLLSEALEARKDLSYYENVSLASVTTSFFLFGCHFCLEKHSAAWFHLREATTLALLAGMHQEDTYRAGNLLELTLRRRLFWLLFVTER